MITAEGGIIRLVHHTAETYFSENIPLILHGAKERISKIFLNYLMMDVLITPPNMTNGRMNNLQDLLQIWPLLEYSATWWSSHLIACPQGSADDAALEFLVDRKYRSLLTQILWASERSRLVLAWDVKNVPTPLHLVCFFRLPRLLAKILCKPDIKLDLHQSDAQGNTPLLWSVRRKDIESVRLLLDAGVDTDGSSSIDGNSALCLAAEQGSLEMVETLLGNEDINVNHCNARGWSALMLAVSNGHCAIVKIMLKRDDIKVDICSQHGAETALHLAIRNGSADIVENLANHPGFDLNCCLFDGVYGLLVFAIRFSNLVMVKILVEAGADIEIRDRFNATPIFRAIDYAKPEIVEYLLNRGANWKALDLFGRGLLHSAAGKAYIDDVKAEVEVMNMLLNATTLNPNLRDKKGTTPLHDAARDGDVKIVELLLANDADVDARDQNEVSPLDIAKEGNREAVISILQSFQKAPSEMFDSSRGSGRVSHKEKVSLSDLVYLKNEDKLKEAIIQNSSCKNFDIDGCGPLGLVPALIVAAAFNQVGMVRILLEGGADINLKDGYGKDALRHTAEKDLPEVAELLITKGVNIDATGKNNLRPLDKAVIEEIWRTARVLVEAGASIADLKPGIAKRLLFRASSCGLELMVSMILAGATTGSANIDVNVNDETKENDDDNGHTDQNMPQPPRSAFDVVDIREALTIAKAQDHETVIRILTEHLQILESIS